MMGGDELQRPPVVALTFKHKNKTYTPQKKERKKERKTEKKEKKKKRKKYGQQCGAGLLVQPNPRSNLFSCLQVICGKH